MPLTALVIALMGASAPARLRAGATAGVRGLVVATVALPAAAQAPAPADVAGLEQSVQQHRERGDYTQALATARRIEDILRRDPSATTRQRGEARSRTEGLQRIAALPGWAQQELAAADRITAQLDAGFAGGDYVAVREGAQRQLEIRRRHLGTQHPDVATSMAYLGVAQQGTGDFQAAERCYRELLQVLHALYGDEHPDVATVLGNLATVVQERGDWLQAEALYRQVLALQRRTLGPDSPDLARSLNNLATLLQRQGDVAGAEPLLREALELCRRSSGPDSLETAFAAANLAEVLLTLAALQPERGRRLLDEAETLSQASLAAHRRALAPGHPDIAAALFDMAQVLVAAGKNALAESDLREALQIRRAALGPDHPDVAQTLSALGTLLARRGRWREAVLAHEQALAIDRAAYGNRHWRVVDDLAALGRLHLQHDDARRALPLLSEAADAWDAARARAGSATKSATAYVAAPYSLLATALLQLGERDAAWQAAERGQGRLLTQLLAATGARALRPAQAAREDSLRRVLADREAQLAALRAAHAGATQLEPARQQLLEAEAAWSALQLSESSRYEGVPALLPLGRVQACLGDDEALIGWVEGPTQAAPAASAGPGSAPAHVWGYVVRKRGPVRWAELSPVRSTGELDPISALRNELAGSGAATLGVADAPQVHAQCAAIYQARVARLLSLARRGGPVTQLAVIPSGHLLGIPLEALEAADGTALLEHCAVTYVPSGASFAWLREQGRAGAQRAAAQMGAAADAGARPALVVGDPPAGELPGLQWSAREARQVAAALPNALLLLGGDASEARFAQLAGSGGLSRFATLHLATHAVVDDVNPEQSALILGRTTPADPLDAIVKGASFTDGRLTAREIVQTWRLRADLVTLSACETGLGRRAEGEGYLGLAYAFFQAGARAVLVSLWNVDDEATALLMERFYRLRAGLDGAHPLSAVHALQEAKRWLRDQRDASGARRFGHPYYWAGFVLLGDDGGAPTEPAAAGVR